MINKWTIGGLIVVIFALFIWGTWGQSGSAATWNGTGIACINGHTNLAFHFHPHLSITVDGTPEPIPANVGISAVCMAEIHTHDTTGELHVEGPDRSRADSFTLADFFAVWGEPFEREGYMAIITINGEPAGSDPSTVILQDQQEIEVAYAASENGSSAQETRVETRIDQGASALDVKVVPLEVVEDSRCPEGVQCVQAGTVRVRALLTSGLGEAPQVFELNRPITTEAEVVELVEVRPAAIAEEEIPLADYRFIFRIAKRTDV